MACNKLFRQSRNSLTHPVFYSLHSVNNNVFKQIINKLPMNRTYSYVSQSHYSTLLYFKEKNTKRSFLRPTNYKVMSALLLSSHESKDAFQVVVTNPSEPSTEFSSDVANIEEVTKILSESGNNLVSAASSTDIVGAFSNDLQTVVQAVEPSLASLGLANNTPVGLVQILLEYMHISCEMPWWMAIAICTISARILLLPILIKTQKNAIHMSNNMPQLQFLQAKFGEARRSGNTMEASRYASEMMQFMKEHNISPLKSALLPLVQAPVFISFFLALRAMAKAPVESMKEGGLWWATDLTIPDPYYIMPLIACGTLYIVLKVGAESGMKLENMKMGKYILQALPVVALPFCINFPAAVLYYWCTTNFCTLMIVSIMKEPHIRQYLKLPAQQPLDPKFVLPKKSFIGGIKEAFEDQKAIATVEDRRRVDEIRFQKSGTGPIPRTYSYDPTKVRPSNVAATANQNRHTVSAKEHKA